MGHQQSTTNQQEKHQNIQVGHPRFEKVKTIKNGNDFYLQITLPVVNDHQITSWQKQYSRFSNYQCLLLPKEHQFKSSNMCGSSGHCNITYDNFPFLLKEQISDRCINNERKYFQNSQLWYLAYTIIEAAHVFHGNRRKIGDVRPINIFINDNGQTKVANKLSWPGQYDNYEKTLYSKEITYLAPQQFVELNCGQQEPRGHFEIAEAFSIGLTLLDSVILSDSSDLYNYNNNRFDYQKLEQKIQQLFSLRYLDNNLKHLIAGLCHTEPRIRLTCKMLYEWLYQYREPIVNIESFQFKEVPPFLFDEVYTAVNFRQTITKSTTKRIHVQQPIYMESQVVSNQPQTVLINRPPSNYNQTQTVVVQQVDNRNQQRKQIHREEPRQSIPSGVIVERMVVKRKGSQDEKKQQRAVHHVSSPQGVVISQSIPVESKVVQYHRQETTQYRTNYETEQTPVRTHVQVSQQYSPSFKNDDQFKSTLEKIQEQLARSRKMFPS